MNTKLLLPTNLSTTVRDCMEREGVLRFCKRSGIAKTTLYKALKGNGFTDITKLALANAVNHKTKTAPTARGVADKVKPARKHQPLTSQQRTLLARHILANGITVVANSVGLAKQTIRDLESGAGCFVSSRTKATDWLSNPVLAKPKRRGYARLTEAQRGHLHSLCNTNGIAAIAKQCGVAFSTISSLERFDGAGAYPKSITAVSDWLDTLPHWPPIAEPATSPSEQTPSYEDPRPSEQTPSYEDPRPLQSYYEAESTVPFYDSPPKPGPATCELKVSFSVDEFTKIVTLANGEGVAVNDFIRDIMRTATS